MAAGYRLRASRSLGSRVSSASWRNRSVSSPRDEFAFLHVAAQEGDLFVGEIEGVPFFVEDENRGISSLSRVECVPRALVMRTRARQGSRTDRSDRHPAPMKGAFSLNWGAIRRELETSSSFQGKAVGVLVEQDIDRVEAVPQIARSALWPRRRVSRSPAGHAARGSDQRGRPDMVTVKDLVARALEVHAVEPMRRFGRLDHVAKLRITPPGAVSFPLDAGDVRPPVTLDSVPALEDVVDPFFQIVEDQQAILFPDGFLDVLNPEARGPR